VGLTRAQERLVLTHAAARSLWGSRGYNLPSRFLDELPQEEIERLRRSDGHGPPRRPVPLHRRLRAPLHPRGGRRHRHRG
jgi:DNA helicase-2/ATP-dependent DNA helicase PcrA